MNFKYQIPNIDVYMCVCLVKGNLTAIFYNYTEWVQVNICLPGLNVSIKMNEKQFRIGGGLKYPINNKSPNAFINTGILIN